MGRFYSSARCPRVSTSYLVRQYLAPYARQGPRAAIPIWQRERCHERLRVGLVGLERQSQDRLGNVEFCSLARGVLPSALRDEGVLAAPRATQHALKQSSLIHRKDARAGPA